MSPILVRPVREQLEHDRVIRLLQLRWRRKFLVTMNQGAETVASVPQGDQLLYPDLVLAANDRGHKPEIVIEVETAESVNTLEALAQWARLARLRAEFHLYIPTGSLDSARRLCQDHNIPVDEIWTYHLVGDQMRFTMVYKAPPTRAAVRAAAARRSANAEAPTAPAAHRASAAPAANPVARKAAAARRPTKSVVATRVRPTKKAAAKPPARAQKRR